MGEKRELVQAVLDELPEVLDEYLPKYLKKHRTELKRWLLNTEGFRSEEEYEALQKEKEALEKELTVRHAREEKFMQEFEACRRELDEIKERAHRYAEELEKVQHDAERRVEMERRKAEEENEELQRYVMLMKEHQSELHRTFEEMQLDRARLAEKYGRAEEVAAQYQSLPEAARQGLAPVLGGEADGLTLVVRLAKVENFQSLWDYGATLLVRGTLDAAEEKALVALVDASLALVNLSHATPLFDIQDVALGTRYLPTTMQKTPASRQQGTVSRVLLPGCVYAGSGNCLRKPLVVVE